jgi:hypothetical protein
MSTTMHDDTLMEEGDSLPKSNVNHMTLRDVSAIVKEHDMDTDMSQVDLSVSLLPFIPTVNHADDKKHNKSIGSTISDKTFVKAASKPFSSDDDSDHDNTLIEQSLLVDRNDKARHLLLTADQSIRLAARRSVRKDKLSLPNRTSREKLQIKQEKLSFRQPIEISQY